jgi:hypothetical protein
MPPSILHVIDPTTPPLGLHMLQTLTDSTRLGVDWPPPRILVLGPSSIHQRQHYRAIWADRLEFKHSAGWWDPTGWRQVRHAVEQYRPEIVQVWGTWGAAAVSTFNVGSVRRILTLAVQPPAPALRLLRIATRRGEWTITSASDTLTRALATAGLPGERIVTILPGIDLAAARGANVGALRHSLGISADAGPIVFAAPMDDAAARIDHTLWASAIMQQMFPRIRVIVPLTDRAPRPEMKAFAESLDSPDLSQIACFAPPEMSFGTLAQAADMAVFNADAPASVEPLLWAMAAGIPVVATATPEVGELIQHGRNGLLAKPGKPRLIAGRMEELMADSTLRWPLADAARREIYERFSVSSMLAGFAKVTESATPVAAESQ